jgi:hypothetical protein
MKRFGSSRPTACPDHGGQRIHVSNPVGTHGPRLMARGRVGVLLDYGAPRVAVEGKYVVRNYRVMRTAVERKTFYSMPGFRF